MKNSAIKIMPQGRYLALGFFILVLGLYNFSIFGKERLLTNGADLILELAPVDPRSIMQGDYMRLDYRVDSELWSLAGAGGSSTWEAPEVTGGVAVLKADAQGVASLVRLHKDEPLEPGELLLRFRLRDGGVRLASHAWFFQEGHAKFYEAARYGLFKVDGKGEALLSAVLDKNLQVIAPPFPEAEKKRDE